MYKCPNCNKPDNVRMVKVFGKYIDGSLHSFRQYKCFDCIVRFNIGYDEIYKIQH